jgi:hypothetical protein
MVAARVITQLTTFPCRAIPPSLTLANPVEAADCRTALRAAA